MTPMLEMTPCPGATRLSTDPLWVVSLDHAGAADGALTGAKASALARAASAGLPVLPGLVITTRGAAALADPCLRPLALRALLRSWTAAAGPDRALVVRSSSTVEDGASSSMAGRFQSVLDVAGWDAFVAAVDEVLASAVIEGHDIAPMAVLVQPMLQPRLGGVLFGADPISGRTDRLLLTAVEGGPDQLVSGRVDGIQLALSPTGRRLDRAAGLPGLGRRERQALAGLAVQTAAVFGGPQDVEWAVDGDRVLLLQSRPITTLAPPPVAHGPVLGPGPVAETLPGVLSPLEADLWVSPLRDGVATALRLAGTKSERALARSPIVTVIGGQVVADLELLGAHRKRGILRKLDPRPGARRLVASWRVGRLRVALPALTEELLGEADEALVDVPDLGDLSIGELAAVLRAAGPHLVSLHAFEVLAGMLAPSNAAGVPTGAVAALHALADARSRGLDDGEILATLPVVLALVPPRVGPIVPLPPVPKALPPVPDGNVPLLVARESLRLRARWLQELMARAAWEIGRRLAETGELASPGDVRHLTLDQLDEVLQGVRPAATIDTADAPAVAPEPLPALFRLGPGGEVVPVASRGRKAAARGAGGGRGSGPVHHGADAPAGSVLVVRTLSPDLAPLLPRLRGLVAETGSVLSHLAILARESGVPVVVGAADALARYPEGTIVTVDGATGDVSVLQTLEGATS
jgi:phosphohistidine swiveling domain-containing protein